MNTLIGFVICAVVMTLFPSIAVKINAVVRKAIDWAIRAFGSGTMVAALDLRRGLQEQGLAPFATVSASVEPGRFFARTADGTTQVPAGTLLYLQPAKL